MCVCVCMCVYIYIYIYIYIIISSKYLPNKKNHYDLVEKNKFKTGNNYIHILR